MCDKFYRSALNVKQGDSLHVFADRSDGPSRYAQIKDIATQFKGIVFTEVELHAILSIGAEAPAATPDKLGAGTPTDKIVKSYAATGGTLHQNISIVPRVLAIELALGNMIPDFPDYRQRFIKLAVEHPCEFKALCAMLLMWYTYLFDALLSRQLGTGTTADAIGLQSERTDSRFPYACANDMFHVEDSVLDSMLSITNQEAHGLCDWSKNFIPCPQDGCYEQEDLGCANIPGQPFDCEDHGASKEWYYNLDASSNLPVRIDGSGANVLQALKVCRHYGNTRQADGLSSEHGFFFQQHENGHMICGYYKDPQTVDDVWRAERHGHHMGVLCNLRPHVNITCAHDQTTISMVQVPIEPYIRLCLQSTLVSSWTGCGFGADVHSIVETVGADTASTWKNCNFDVSGAFNPARVIYQTLQCAELQLPIESDFSDGERVRCAQTLCDKRSSGDDAEVSTSG